MSAILARAYCEEGPVTNMYRHFDDELKDLKDRILAMGGHVESAVEEATQALLLRQPDRLKAVYDLEETINREHIEVDEACVDLLARQSPLASNLRLIIVSKYCGA